ncbi:MAG: molybdopterin molybdenumtransferase MoeA [Alphaproteobacteria bacterium]|jgi:molybdopterin molybdotransferase|nr:molybdopterin molybdenumtransferase MoeA [Alphaproteobacteria bacterium]
MSLSSLEDALEHLAGVRPQTAARTCPLSQAAGARLAAPVIAKVSRPPAAVSAMDGYGVRLADLGKPGAILKVIGEVPAGRPFAGRVGPGEAVRIFTGGEIPDGADHVVIQEEVTREGDRVTCHEGYGEAQYVRPAGMDFAEGDMVIAAGTRIGAFELAMAAAANHDRLEVHCAPRVAILANGDELKPPGSALAPGEIVNSNPPGLAALVRAWGGEPMDLGVAGDTVSSIREHLARASDADILLPVGGASVGEHDHMRTALAEKGFEILFQGVRVKPGKPTWAGRDARRVVLGLPGNPASALVCAHLFLKPLLMGAHAHRRWPAGLAAPLPANGPRRAFLRAHAQLDPEQGLLVRADENQDSSRLSPFIAGNCLIDRAEDAPAAKAGDRVQILWLEGAAPQSGPG